MALNAEALEFLRTALAELKSPGELCATLRSRLPGISVTNCDASDMDADTPALETDLCSVYFIDTSEHCVKLTHDPVQATGVVVASKKVMPS